MLILSRRQGERLIFTLPDGRAMGITVNELRGKTVRLSIEAPRDIHINRAERLLAIAAADPQPDNVQDLATA